RARSELARQMREVTSLEAALGTDAEGVQMPAADVADDEVLQHLVEELRACVEQVMLRRAERAGALPELRRGLLVEPTRVDGDGHDRPAVGLLEPRNAERGVEPAGKPEHDRTLSFSHDVTFLKACRNRARSRRCCAEPAVAMKIVSSPETVLTISGQATWSSVTATRCAAPISVVTTSKFGPAVRRSRTASATTVSACALPI